MNWQIEGDKSIIQFSVKHMMVQTVKGRFKNVSGKVEWDEENPSNSYVEAVVETASIETNENMRDKNLRSSYFFDVKNFPTMTFKSTRIRQMGQNKYRLTGNLTIKGVTREVNFEVEYAGKSGYAFSGDTSPFHASATISRKTFGLNWNSALSAAGMLVGDEIKIELLIKAVKEAEKSVAA
jgi:polyisoprenoid-binding protein YceI